MAEQYKKPYLESSVFIALIKGESIPQTDADGKVIGHEERANIAKHILSLAEAGHFHVYTSSITITEVHKGNSNAQPGTDPESKTIDFFRNRFFKIVDVDRSLRSRHTACAGSMASSRMTPFIWLVRFGRDATHCLHGIQTCSKSRTVGSESRSRKPSVRPFLISSCNLKQFLQSLPQCLRKPMMTPDGSAGVAKEAAISVQPGQETSSPGDTETTPATRRSGQTGNASSPTSTSANVQNPAKEQEPAVASASDSDEAESRTST